MVMWYGRSDLNRQACASGLKPDVFTNFTTPANFYMGYNVYMPMYEYKCSACGKTTEEIQKFDSPPPEECPHCGKKHTLERALGAPNFQLKGGGWASDGYS